MRTPMVHALARSALSLGLLAASLSLGFDARAQEAAPVEDGAEAAPVEGEATPDASVVERREQFPIRRGLFVTGDFGGYFSFGGINTNVPGFPDKTISNFQPMVGVNVGYDVLTNEQLNIAVALRGALSYNAGSGVVDRAVAQPTHPVDFDMYQVGVAAKFGFMLLDRLTLNAVIDGGLALVTPDPDAAPVLPGTDTPNPNAGETAIGGMFGVGPGLEFHTLLPGFSVGLDLRFQGTFFGNAFVPGMSITAPLKYNF